MNALYKSQCHCHLLGEAFPGPSETVEDTVNPWLEGPTVVPGSSVSRVPQTSVTFLCVRITQECYRMQTQFSKWGLKSCIF
jgi:hypothetical protein